MIRYCLYKVKKTKFIHFLGLQIKDATLQGSSQLSPVRGWVGTTSGSKSRLQWRMLALLLLDDDGMQTLPECSLPCAFTQVSVYLLVLYIKCIFLLTWCLARAQVPKHR